MSPFVLPRREFLRDCVRYPLLAGLAALGGLVAWRRGEVGSSELCLKQRVCRGCGLLPECVLPQAQAARQRDS